MLRERQRCFFVLCRHIIKDKTPDASNGPLCSKGNEGSSDENAAVVSDDEITLKVLAIEIG